MIFTITNPNTPEFSKALTACQMAFGIMVTLGDVVTVYTVAIDETEFAVIMEALEDAGSKLIEIVMDLAA